MRGLTVNSQGASPAKWLALTTFLEKCGEYDFISIIEDHEHDRTNRAGHQAFLIASSPGPRLTNGNRCDGIITIASPGCKQLVSDTRSGLNRTAFKAHNKWITSVYLPPRWSAEQCSTLLDDVSFTDIIMGDFNTKLGAAVGLTEEGPEERIDLLTSWMGRYGFQIQRPFQHPAPPKWDHVFAKVLLPQQHSLLDVTALGIISDHRLALDVVIDLDQTPFIAFDDGLLRFRTAKLNDREYATAFRNTFSRAGVLSRTTRHGIVEHCQGHRRRSSPSSAGRPG